MRGSGALDQVLSRVLTAMLWTLRKVVVEEQPSLGPSDSSTASDVVHIEQRDSCENDKISTAGCFSRAAIRTGSRATILYPESSASFIPVARNRRAHSSIYLLCTLLTDEDGEREQRGDSPRH